MDGYTTAFELDYNADNILDAAMLHGADLPYACKAGVCCTCRAKVTTGTVDMTVNYALEPQEIADGFVLSCQAIPTAPHVVLDFDAK
jgi:ring-1,2-phenylacetyl-CoA epoxidase subunit PaaE